MNEGFEMMRKRITWQGGNQEERMIKDKLNSFRKALNFSYQSVWVQNLKDPEGTARKALLNPNISKQDYDDKIISIEYDYDYKCGDVFEWVGTGTHWIIYNRELTEDAYFRADVRRCKYFVNWIDESTHKYCGSWVYARGPVETKINSLNKGDYILDTPNLSLDMYIPLNEESKAKFVRYSRFMLDNKVWQVQTADTFSMEGVIQVTALEHYSNGTLDSTDDQLTGAVIFKPIVEPREGEEKIIGNGFMKPTFDEVFTCVDGAGSWGIEEANRPITLTPQADGSVLLAWTSMKSGSFTLCWSDGTNEYKRYIVVESLF